MGTSKIKDEILEDKLTLKKHNSGKSDVWNCFYDVVDGTGIILNGIVACVKCSKAFTFDSHQTGTSTLRRHKCAEPGSTKKIQSYFKKSAQAKVSVQHKEQITKSCMRFVVE